MMMESVGGIFELWSEHVGQVRGSSMNHLTGLKKRTGMRALPWCARVRSWPACQKT